MPTGTGRWTERRSDVVVTLQTRLSRQGSARAGGAILISRFAANALVNYGLGLALAWLLVPDQFGVVAALQTVLLLGGLLLSAGLPWFVARRVAAPVAASPGRPPPEVGAMLRTAVLGNAAIGLLLGAAFWLSQTYGIPLVPTHSAVVTGCVALTLPLIGLNAVLTGALQGSRRFAGMGAVQSGEVLVKAVVSVLLAGVLSFGPAGVAIGFLGGALVATALGIRGLHDLLPPGPLAPLAGFGAAVPMFGASAAFALLPTVDLLGLQVVGTAAAAIPGGTSGALAVYQVSSILARAPYYVADAVIDAVFPFMASAKDSRSAHHWFVSAFRWVPLALVPLIAVLLLAPRPVLAVCFPGGYATAAPVLRLLAVGSLGLILAGMQLKALFARDLAARAVAPMVASAVVELAGIVLLVPVSGALGAAEAFTAGSWAGALALAVVYRRAVGRLSVRPLRVAGYLLALAVTGGALAAADALPAVAAVPVIAVALLLFLALAALAGVLPTELTGPASGPLSRTRAAGRRLQLRVESLPWPGPWLRARRWVLLAGLVAAAAMLVNLSRSPDTLYDETVYTEAARSVATGWQLTWTGIPFFVHPPLYFLAQAAWLKITGTATGSFFSAVVAARVLTAVCGLTAALLTAGLARRLMPRASAGRARALAAVVVVLTALDPTVVRYSRLAIIEPVALVLALTTLLVAWRLRRAPVLRFAGWVGALTGVTLLTKEVTVFLLLTPVVFGLLRRRRDLVGRGLAGLGAGIAVWLAFPLWSVAIGRFPDFLDVKTATLQRLLGASQITGWNRPGVSFPQVLWQDAGQYAPTYLALGVGAGALVWLWLRRNGEAGDYLLAWVGCGFAFAAYNVAAGTLNEQFFVYVVPGAVVASVAAADAAHQRLRRGPRRAVPFRPQPAGGGVVIPFPATRRLARTPVSRTRLALAAVPLVLLAVTGATSAVSWATHYATRHDGVRVVDDYLKTHLPTGSTINASGDPDKFAAQLPGYTFTTFASGPEARSYGVQYFILTPFDVFARYGAMTPQLASWITGHGRLLLSAPTSSGSDMQLWRVTDAGAGAGVPVGVEQVDGGLFVTTRGSRAAGFLVPDGPAGDFATAYQAVGGRDVVGAPRSRVFTDQGSALQVFDDVVLGTSGPAGPSAQVAPLPMVSRLAVTKPGDYSAAGLPVLVSAFSGTTRVTALTAAQVTARLTDPAIARAYLGTSPDQATAADLARARSRFGYPISLPATGADGTVRQAFENVVIGRPADGPAQPQPISALLQRSGVLQVPQSATVAQAPPALPTDLPPAQNSDVRPFLAVLAGFGLLAGGAAWRRRRPGSASDREVAA